MVPLILKSYKDSCHPSPIFMVSMPSSQISSRSGDDGSNPHESKTIVLIVLLLVQAKLYKSKSQ